MTNLIIVDDDVRIVATYELILEKAGHRVLKVFSNGKEIVDYFRERILNPQIAEATTSNRSTDAIILDYRMPVMDGLETAKILRKMGVRTKIIFVSAFDLPAETKAYYDIVLQKPISANQLLQAASEIEVANA